MSYFGLVDGSSVNTLFSSLNKGSAKNNFSNSTALGNSLSDYASIRSGSYYKLLKAYYAKPENSSVSGLVDTSTSVAKDTPKKLAELENSAESLKESADALITKGSKSVFQKTTVNQPDGTVKSEYNISAIYEKVNTFVKDYNGMLAGAEDTDTKAISSAAEQLEGLTKSNAKMLSKIGITVNKDNSLSIDKEVFNKADMNAVKSLFNGNGSYAYQVSVKASMIDFSAQNEASKANTYGNKGSYNKNYNYGSNYNNFI